MKLLRATLFCLLASGAAQAQTLTGQWCGIAEQVGPGAAQSAWSVSPSIKGAGGVVEYPSLKCGGTLTFERTQGSIHYYRERITYGRDNCIDEILVAIEPLGASIRVEWTGSGTTSNAVLSTACPGQSPHAGRAAS